jgi:hypothetical protein
LQFLAFFTTPIIAPASRHDVGGGGTLPGLDKAANDGMKGTRMQRFLSAAILALLWSGAAMAEAAQGGPPAILQPANGATVDNPVTILIRAGSGAAAAMAAMPGMVMAHGAHYHLIIDAPLPATGTAIPMDAHHLHLMRGESQKTLTLAPGRHTLQLIEGSMSHRVAANAPHSDLVTFQVKG